MLPSMSESPNPKPAARLARERRLHVLRMRIAAFAVATFVALWVGLYVQLVSGDDPALARDVAPVATQSADPAATSDGGRSTGAASAQSSEASGAGAVTTTQTQQPAAVTTRQS
jgi:hypothetical protein